MFITGQLWRDGLWQDGLKQEGCGRMVPDGTAITERFWQNGFLQDTL